MYRTILTVAAVAPLARGDYSYSYDAPWAVAAWLADPTAAGATYGGPIAAWNTSGVTNMRTLFCGSIFYCLSWPGAASFDDDISGWDISGVTTMRSMFIEASAFNQDLGWCISASVDVFQMFSGAGCASTSCGVTFDCP
jgi:hypothetical protein